MLLILRSRAKASLDSAQPVPSQVKTRWCALPVGDVQGIDSGAGMQAIVLVLVLVPAVLVSNRKIAPHSAGLLRNTSSCTYV